MKMKEMTDMKNKNRKRERHDKNRRKKTQWGTFAFSRPADNNDPLCLKVMTL